MRFPISKRSRLRLQLLAQLDQPDSPDWISGCAPRQPFLAIGLTDNKKMQESKPFAPLFSTRPEETNPFSKPVPRRGGAAEIEARLRVSLWCCQRFATRFTSRLHHTAAGFED